MAGPWEKYGGPAAAPAAAAGPVYGPAPKPAAPPPAPTPLQLRDQELQEGAARRQELEWNATHNPDGTPKPKPTAAEKPADRARIANIDALVGQINRVQELYEQNLQDEAIPLLSSLWEYLPTETNRQFDAAAAGMAEQGLAAFRVPGVGAQSDTELRQFVAANKPAASNYDTEVEEKLRQLRNRVDANRAAMGLPPAEWRDSAARQDEPAGLMGTADAGEPPAPGGDGNPRPLPFRPGDPSYTPSGGTRTVADRPDLAAEYRQRLGANQSATEILKWLRSEGAEPQTLMQAVEQIRYRRANPDVPLDRYSITSTKEVPLTAFEQAATSMGSGTAGAYALGAGQMLSGNTLDNLARDSERANLALGVSQASSPTAFGLGQISGGVMAGLTGEAGLARLGMGAGIGRGIVADAAMGGANAAGAADQGGRVQNALLGALTGGAASGAGSIAMRGVGNALAPSGGRMSELYASGVRPTPGQRFADSGVVGRAFNATEEAMQSVPLVGAAVHGARQEARDQFQLGAFNQALAEVGERLPKGVKPGTQPHAYAQQVFDRVYEEARSGMRVVADEELSSDISGLFDRVGMLARPSISRFKAITENVVMRRISNGNLEGDAYKAAYSGLGKQIRSIRNSASGDGELADALQDLQNVLDAAARRHSDPAAVELLDAADAGYAKLVRIEEAAKSVGGDAGTFGPAQFDRAVQRTSGGTRSKAYLRGDALMQEYAEQGRGLSDRLPNSGTVDRALQVAGPGAAAGAFLEPTVAATLGTVGALYAPGVRNVVKGAMAPSGPKARAIAARLKKRARLIGSAGAASAVAALPGTSPAQ